MLHKPKSKALFQPFSFPNGTSAPNRLFVSAMTNNMSQATGSASSDDLHFLSTRITGGWGGVTTCAAFVDISGRCWPGQLGVCEPFHFEQLAKLKRHTHGHRHPALTFVQLHHGGVRVPETLRHEGRVWGPVARGWGGESCSALTETQIHQLVQSFSRAARGAEQAGFAGCEVHGAHGYLLTQFLSRSLNTRCDRYGGSRLLDRARFLLETLRSIKKQTSSRFVLGVRLSPESYSDVTGLSIAETLELQEILDAEGLDFIHHSMWDTRKAHRTMRLAEALSSRPTRLLKSASGKIWNRADAEWTLRYGMDYVHVGRAALNSPRWPHQIADHNVPHLPPYSQASLRSARLGDAFINYMKKWDGFVGDEHC